MGKNCQKNQGVLPPITVPVSLPLPSFASNDQKRRAAVFGTHRTITRSFRIFRIRCGTDGISVQIRGGIMLPCRNAAFCPPEICHKPTPNHDSRTLPRASHRCLPHALAQTERRSGRSYPLRSLTRCQPLTRANTWSTKPRKVIVPRRLESW